MRLPTLSTRRKTGRSVMLEWWIRSLMLKHNSSAKSPPGTAPLAQSAPFRFGLRSLFILLAAIGIVCALLRSLVQGDPSIFLGIGAFCYGGIIAIPVYAF